MNDTIIEELKNEIKLINAKLEAQNLLLTFLSQAAAYEAINHDKTAVNFKYEFHKMIPLFKELYKTRIGPFDSQAKPTWFDELVPEEDEK